MEVKINAANLRKQRIKNGISQKDLADSCGISRQYVSLLESQQRENINYDKLCRMACYLNCSTDYLSGEVSEPDHHIGQKAIINEKTGAITYEKEEQCIYNKAIYVSNYMERIKHKLSYLSDSDLLYIDKVIDIFLSAQDKYEQRKILYYFFDCLSLQNKQFKRHPIKKPSEYIYVQLQDEILPSLIKEAYDFISSDERLQTLSFFKHYKNSVDLRKGHIDECLSIFREQTIDQIKCTIKECINLFIETPSPKLGRPRKTLDIPLSSKTPIFLSDINHILESIQSRTSSGLKAHTNSLEFKKNLPSMTYKEKCEVLIDLQETLLFNQQQYLRSMVNILDSFLKKYHKNF